MRATSVAKYQPPERISAAGPSAITTPSPSSTTRWANVGGELDVVGGDDDAGAAVGQALDQLDQVAACGPGPCRGSARRGRRGPAARRRPCGRPARSPAPAAGARRRRGRGGRRRPRAPGRRCAAPPSRRRPAARRRPARGPGSRWGSGSAGRCRRESSALPRTGSTRPASVRSSVLLPAPLRPISATRSPRCDLQVDSPEDVARSVSCRLSSTQRSRVDAAGGSCRRAGGVRAVAGFFARALAPLELSLGAKN